MLTPESFGLSADQLRVVVIAPDAGIDLVGIVTALEGEPLPSGDIASRLGGFADVSAIEASNAGGNTTTTDAELIELLLGSKNTLHNNYQDFQAFLDHRRQDRAAARPAALRRLPAQPVPGARRARADARREPGRGRGRSRGSSACPRPTRRATEFKFGSIVRPGHRGIWQEPLRTGKYPINPRVYAAEIVPDVRS